MKVILKNLALLSLIGILTNAMLYYIEYKTSVEFSPTFHAVITFLLIGALIFNKKNIQDEKVFEENYYDDSEL